MNYNYLKKVLIPQRELEIKNGDNLATRQPIYVVLDLQENIISRNTDSSEYHEFTVHCNLKDIPSEYGYYDQAEDEPEFSTYSYEMKDPVAVTRFFTDTYVAFFLTSKGAHDYLKYQAHNLSKRAYVYVFSSGYRNNEMDMLLDNK
jgi:hypothetical protein